MGAFLSKLWGNPNSIRGSKNNSSSAITAGTTANDSPLLPPTLKSRNELPKEQRTSSKNDRKTSLQSSAATSPSSSPVASKSTSSSSKGQDVATPTPVPVITSQPQVSSSSSSQPISSQQQTSSSISASKSPVPLKVDVFVPQQQPKEQQKSFTTTFETVIVVPKAVPEDIQDVGDETNSINIDADISDHSPEVVEDAVVKIQAGVRGYLTRKNLREQKVTRGAEEASSNKIVEEPKSSGEVDVTPVVVPPPEIFSGATQHEVKQEVKQDEPATAEIKSQVDDQKATTEQEADVPPAPSEPAPKPPQVPSLSNIAEDALPKKVSQQPPPSAKEPEVPQPPQVAAPIPPTPEEVVSAVVEATPLQVPEPTAGVKEPEGTPQVEDLVAPPTEKVETQEPVVQPPPQPASQPSLASASEAPIAPQETVKVLEEVAPQPDVTPVQESMPSHQNASVTENNMNNSTEATEADAAVRIQAAYRGYRTRKQMSGVRTNHNDANPEVVMNGDGEMDSSIIILEGEPEDLLVDDVEIIPENNRPLNLQLNLEVPHSDSAPSSPVEEDAATKIQAAYRGYQVRKSRSREPSPFPSDDRRDMRVQQTPDQKKEEDDAVTVLDELEKELVTELLKSDPMSESSQVMLSQLPDIMMAETLVKALDSVAETPSAEVKSMPPQVPESKPLDVGEKKVDEEMERKKKEEFDQLMDLLSDTQEPMYFGLSDDEDDEGKGGGEETSADVFAKNVADVLIRSAVSSATTLASGAPSSAGKDQTSASSSDHQILVDLIPEISASANLKESSIHEILDDESLPDIPESLMIDLKGPLETPSSSSSLMPETQPEQLADIQTTAASPSSSAPLTSTSSDQSLNIIPDLIPQQTVSRSITKTDSPFPRDSEKLLTDEALGFSDNFVPSEAAILSDAERISQQPTLESSSVNVSQGLEGQAVPAAAPEIRTPHSGIPRLVSMSSKSMDDEDPDLPGESQDDASASGSMDQPQPTFVRGSSPNPFGGRKKNKKGKKHRGKN